MLQRTIDGIKFTVKKLDVFDANDLDRELQELLPDALQGLDKAMKDTDDFLDIDLSGVGEIITKLFEKMPRENFREFCVKMLACVSYENGDKQIELKSEDLINACGLKVSGLYKLLWAVMEENGFLPFDLLAFGGVTEKIRDSLTAALSTNSTPEGSDGSES